MAKAKKPALRTRVNALKRLLRSGEPAQILVGAGDLAAHDPEVADALLEGVERKESERDAWVWFTANKTFTGTAAAQPLLSHGLLLAILFAPDASEVANDLRGDLTHLATAAGALPIDVVLERLPGLQGLKVSRSIPSCLDAVAGSSLTRLELARMHRGTVDLEPLRGAVNLERLDISGRPTYTGLDALATLVELTVLSLNSAHGIDLRNLPPALEELRIGESRDVVGAEAIPATVRLLDVSGVAAPPMSHIASLPLETLGLRSCGPVDLRPLGGHETLQRLWLTRCEVTTLDGLAGLPRLTNLSLSRLQDLKSLRGLSDCPLEKVYIEGCSAVADVEALRVFPHLKELELRGLHALTDLAAVLALGALEKRTVYRCGAELPRPPEDPIERSRFPDSWVRSRAYDTLSTVAGTAALEAIAAGLADPAPHNRQQAASALARRDDGIGMLVRELEKGNADAAWALFSHRRAEAVAPLAALVEAGADELAAIAALCLSRCPGADAAIPALTGALQAEDPALRRWAAFTLGVVGGPADALIPLITDEDWRVRRAVLGALAALGSEAVRRGLEDVEPSIVSITAAWLDPVAPPDAPLPPVDLQPAQLSHSDPTSRLPRLRNLPNPAKLEELILRGRYHNIIGDTYVFPKMPSLRMLTVLSRKMTAPTPIVPLVSLESLNIGYNKKLKTLDGLEKLTQLRQLYIYNSSVGDLSPLAGLPLTHLSASHTRVSDLTPLFNCPLRQLNLDHTRVASLDGIAALPELEVLTLRKTRVQDISPLGGLRHLESLSLEETGVTDFAALARLPSLRELVLRETAFDHAELLLSRTWRRLKLDAYRGLKKSDPIGYRALREAVEGDDGKLW